jgi:hypothetical protein
MLKRAEPRHRFSTNVLSERLLCCSNVMLSLLYVLIVAKRADFSTISTFVNFLMQGQLGSMSIGAVTASREQVSRIFM